MPCARLSWPSRQLLSAYKYTALYRIVSYQIIVDVLVHPLNLLASSLQVLGWRHASSILIIRSRGTAAAVVVATTRRRSDGTGRSGGCLRSELTDGRQKWHTLFENFQVSRVPTLTLTLTQAVRTTIRRRNRHDDNILRSCCCWR